jgi:putative thioredoxin
VYKQDRLSPHTIDLHFLPILINRDKMRGMENVIEVSEDSFDLDVIEQSFDLPVVVDFWAPWCAPCLTLSPILEKLASDPDHEFILAKINVDDNPGLAMEFQVQGIPAVKAFWEGDVIAEFTGAQPESSVRQFIRKVAPSERDLALRQAKSLLATRHWADAEMAFREVLERFPYLPAASLGLATALIVMGDGCEAITYLKGIGDGPELLQAKKLLPLATFLCRQEEMDAVGDETADPIDIQYQHAARLFRRSNMAAALDGLLEVLRQDKRHRNGEAKAVVLAIFEILGEGDPLTQTYRRELATVLF